MKNVSKVLCAIALVVFVLVAFGVTFLGATPLEITSGGLAFLAAAYLLA